MRIKENDCTKLINILYLNKNTSGCVMKFLWTTIHVKNMEESLKFYLEVVGLKTVNRFNSGPGMEISFLGEDDTKIELIFSEKFKNIDAGNAVTLGFKGKSQ